MWCDGVEITSELTCNFVQNGFQIIIATRLATTWLLFGLQSSATCWSLIYTEEYTRHTCNSAIRPIILDGFTCIFTKDHRLCSVVITLMVKKMKQQFKWVLMQHWIYDFHYILSLTICWIELTVLHRHSISNLFEMLNYKIMIHFLLLL